MRNKQFVINSIKMDLHRVVTGAGNIAQTFPIISVTEFLQHANKNFDKIELSNRETALRTELQQLIETMKDNIQDPHKRLRWTEKVLDIRCRL
jgi:transcriptional regulator GlxA family with amidase domain